MIQTLELPVAGMDCAACARKAQRALMRVPGVQNADVLLNAEKAVIQFDAGVATPDALRATIEKVGFTVPQPVAVSAESEAPPSHVLEAKALQRQLFTTLGLLFGAILFVVVMGEGLGMFDALTGRVPFWAGLAAVLVFGYPIFRDVIRSTLRREVTSHTLMTLGAISALAIGQWTTAAIVVFFMRIGERSGPVCLNSFPRFLSGFRTGCQRCRDVHGGGRRLRRTHDAVGISGRTNDLHLTRPASTSAGRRSTPHQA